MADSTGPPSRALVWDLDGTLIDSVEDLADALNALLEEHRLPPHELYAVRGMIGRGAVRLIDVGFADAGRAIGTEGAQALLPRFLEIYADRATRKTRLADGAAEVLDRLGKSGFVHAVCTNKPQRISMQILDALGVAGRFAAVIGGDSTARKKPDAEPMLACLAALGVEPSDAIMIGDSRVDVEAARAVDMPVIVVSYGYANEPIRQLAPDAVIDSLAELPKKLGELSL